MKHIVIGTNCYSFRAICWSWLKEWGRQFWLHNIVDTHIKCKQTVVHFIPFNTSRQIIISIMNSRKYIRFMMTASSKKKNIFKFKKKHQNNTLLFIKIITLSVQARLNLTKHS